MTIKWTGIEICGLSTHGALPFAQGHSLLSTSMWCYIRCKITH